MMRQHLHDFLDPRSAQPLDLFCDFEMECAAGRRE
jgi:hypothetical protein